MELVGTIGLGSGYPSDQRTGAVRPRKHERGLARFTFSKEDEAMRRLGFVLGIAVLALLPVSTTQGADMMMAASNALKTASTHAGFAASYTAVAEVENAPPPRRELSGGGER